MATLVLATRALDLVGTHATVAANARRAQVVTLATVVPVFCQVLAVALAHVLASRANALAVLALGRVVAVLTTLATVVLVQEGVLQGMGPTAGLRNHDAVHIMPFEAGVAGHADVLSALRHAHAHRNSSTSSLVMHSIDPLQYAQPLMVWTYRALIQTYYCAVQPLAAAACRKAVANHPGHSM